VEPGEFELLARTWFPVARLQDLDSAPAQATLLGQELVVYRGPAGVTVADGWCPHRGMKLAMGLLVNGELQCPYHGWRFEAGSGRCVAVPSLPAHLPPTRVCLNTYPVRLAYGMVWTCLREPWLDPLQIPELDGEQWRPDVEDGLGCYRVGDWTVALGEPRYVRCGIRALSENFRDMAHFAFVHRASMGPDVRREVDEYGVEREGWTLRYTLSSHPEGALITDGQDAAAPARPPAAAGNDLKMSQVAYGRTNHYTIVLPCSTYIFSRLPGGGRRLVAQFVGPAAQDGETVHLFWAVGVDAEATRRHGVTVRDAHDFDAQVFQEDIPIVENSWPREQPLDPKAQVHTRADAYSVAYRRAYRQLLDEFLRGSPELPERSPAQA
jgi:phenylpropionate dioxygenase-like ring-hydroxylating dioxygenase large terminal subunit